MARPVMQALLALLCLVVLVRGGETPSIPTCALNCAVEVYSQGFCALDDAACLCTNEALGNALTTCVLGHCTTPEALLAKNLTVGGCGEPVRDQSESYAPIAISMIVIAAVCTLFRFMHKIWFKLPLGLDDWMVLATLCWTVASAILALHGALPNGLGKDIWTLTSQQISGFLRVFYHMAWMYFIEVTLVKLAIIAFYMRIFPSQGVQRLLWATFIFTTLWGLAYVLACIFQCQPISYFWNGWDGLHEGSCDQGQLITLSHAVINIILDLWALALPLWQLRGVQLHWKKKIGVVFMFCIGTVVTIVSILRLQTLVVIRATYNPTYDFYNNTVWSSFEVSIGIICTCLPALRFLLVRLFPILGGGTSRRNQSNKYYNYGDGPKSGVSHKARSHMSRATIGITTAPRGTSGSDSSDREIPSGGIMFEKTFDMHFSDEAKLVEMKALDHSGRSIV